MNDIPMIKKIIYPICIACLVLGGCTDDNMLPVSQPSLSTKTVPVELSLGIEDYNTSPSGETRAEAGNPVLSVSRPDMDIELVKTPLTRVVSAVGIDKENAVYSYFILQFAGTGADAQLLDMKLYFSPDGAIHTNEVDLMVTGTARHRFVIIANVNSEDVPLTKNVSRYSDLQNLFLSWSLGDDLFPLHKVTLQGVGTKDAIIMCGMTDAVIADKGKQISIGLKRTVAKVTFNIKTDNPAFEKFKNWDVAIVDIPVKSYLSTLGRVAVFPDATDYYTKVFTSAQGDRLPITGKSAYLPINLQHTVPTATQYTRRDNAPIGGTYLQIMGREVAQTSNIPIVKDYVIYQVFLGKNLTTDYSIYPNYNLTYTLTLKNRKEDDTNVVRFIPGYFSGSLTAYDEAGNPLPTTNSTGAVKWKYPKKIEAYFQDASYPLKYVQTQIETVGRKDIRWYVGSDYNNLGATSLVNGFENTRRLQGSTTTYVRYPAAVACYAGLNGLPNAGTQSFMWYLPSIGELIGTWISSSSTVPTLSQSYWSSTAAKTNPEAYIITTQGEVKTAPVNDDGNRHYVRGVRDPRWVDGY